MQYVLYTIVLLPVFIAAILLLGRPLLRKLRQREAEIAVRQFHAQREQLEAKFFDIARQLGKPRGLRWIDCEWLDHVAFGREADTAQLTAFAAVNIRFEAVEGGDMEDVEAVSTVRDASALFHYRNGNWGTGGRALFNLDPDTALERLSNQYEPVDV